MDVMRFVFSSLAVAGALAACAFAACNFGVSYDGLFDGGESDARPDVTASDAAPDTSAQDASDAGLVDVKPDVPIVALFRINVGGTKIGLFDDDNFFTSGSTNSVGNTIDYSLVGEAGAPPEVYQNYRFADTGAFLYTFTTDPFRDVTVRLHFAEVFQTDAGARIFDVSINGTVVLKSFDVLATTGAQNRVIIKDFPAQATSTGTIQITYTTTLAGSAMGAGIEVYTR